jgi:malonyl-CoA O-methyltransferase
MINDTLTPIRELRKSFNSQASLYDEYAVAQHISARNLASVLATYQEEVCGKTIVEYGAGTGMVTEHLVRLFPDSKIIATDISPNMLASSYDKYSSYPNITYELHDANISYQGSAIANVVVCAFTVQWLDDPVAAVSKWLLAMAKPALIFLTWPGEGSFPEWKRAADHAGLAFTGNSLPGTQFTDAVASNCSAEIVYHSVDALPINYPSAIDFFRSIRNIGAGTELDAIEGRRNLLRLARVWDGLSDGHITATYHVHTAVLTSN